MARGHDSEEFFDPRRVSEGSTRKLETPSLNDEHRDEMGEEREQGTAAQDNPSAPRSSGLRKVYDIRGRTYRLRTSEIATTLEIGKFRVLAVEDLREFAYDGDKTRMRPEVENLIRQGLVQMKSVPHEDKGKRQLLALTKAGHRFLTQGSIAGKDQALYHGFSKPCEAHHDADLYRLFQKAAEKIEGAGGRNLRVVLDYELKKRVYHDLAKLGPDRVSAGQKRSVAERHGLQVVSGKIPLPDVRIEYDTPDGDRARVDIELATNHYRLRNLAEKVLAGFSIYAHPSDVSNLRRVLDQRELTAEILSL
jgi:hypothetical protein